MDFAPAVFAVGDVGAGDADAVADVGHEYGRHEAGAGSVRVRAGGRIVIADRFDDQTAMAVNGVDEIEDSGLVGLDGDVEVAVRFSLDCGDATFDCGARFDDMKTLGQVDVTPERGFAGRGWQCNRSAPGIVQAREEIQRCKDDDGQENSLH